MHILRYGFRYTGAGGIAALIVMVGVYVGITHNPRIVIALGAIYAVGVFLTRCVNTAVLEQIETFRTSVWDRVLVFIGLIAGYFSIARTQIPIMYRLETLIFIIGIIILTGAVAVAMTLYWLSGPEERAMEDLKSGSTDWINNRDDKE